MDIVSVFEKEKEDKPVKVGKFGSRNYIEHEINGDRNKTLLIQEYVNKTRLNLKDIKNDL